MEDRTQNPPHTDMTSPVSTNAGARRGLRLRVLIPFLVLALIVAAAVGYWYFELRGVVSTDDAYIDGNRVSLSAEMLGRIDWLGADEGDTVREGQQLVQLDDRDLRAQEAQAQASLEHAQTSVRLAEVNLARAQDDLRRATTQFQAHAISQEAFDHAKAAVDAADAQHRIALSQVRTAHTQLGVVDAKLADTRIAAPFTGVVAKRWVMAGDVVQPSQPILTIFDLAHVWVTANLEETKLARVRLGDSVDVSVDAYPGRKFAGTVILIGAAAASQFALLPPANASGNFTKVTQRVPIRVSLTPIGGDGADPAPLHLLPGMFVEIHVHIGSR